MNATTLIAGQRHTLYQKLATQSRYTQPRKTRHTSRLLPDQPVTIYFDPLTGQLTTDGPAHGPLKELPQT